MNHLRAINGRELNPLLFRNAVGIVVLVHCVTQDFGELLCASIPAQQATATSNHTLRTSYGGTNERKAKAQIARKCWAERHRAFHVARLAAQEQRFHVAQVVGRRVDCCSWLEAPSLRRKDDRRAEARERQRSEHRSTDHERWLVKVLHRDAVHDAARRRAGPACRDRIVLFKPVVVDCDDTHIPWVKMQRCSGVQRRASSLCIYARSNTGTGARQEHACF